MIYLNGSFIPIEDARISVLDRGFIFGDGVYEVIPVYSHIPFRLAEHLGRLQESLDGIQLKNPHTDIEWKELLEQIIASNEGEDQSLYLHITRGVAPRNHAFPKEGGAYYIYYELSFSSSIKRANCYWCFCNHR